MSTLLKSFDDAECFSSLIDTAVLCVDAISIDYQNYRFSFDSLHSGTGFLKYCRISPAGSVVAVMGTRFDECRTYRDFPYFSSKLRCIDFAFSGSLVEALIISPFQYSSHQKLMVEKIEEDFSPMIVRARKHFNVKPQTLVEVMHNVSNTLKNHKL